ncbi:MAG TPA: protein kinase, partial [Sandaracinaceae bacterium]
MARICQRCSHHNEDHAKFCLSCGAMLEVEAGSNDDPLLGKVLLGRYRPLSVLGEGGMGKVYLAEQKMGTATRKVAIKTLHPELSNDPQLVARFHRESETVIELRHPNTIQFYDFGELDDGTLIIVMEYIQGKPLAKVLEEEGAIDPKRADKIIIQICGSLHEAHQRGIVHRDLKPENILLTDQGGQTDFVKVLDFGIAKVERPARDTGQPLTRLGTILGTPEYMAPEQALGEKVGPAADLYAVGVMLYEMLTGKHPFDTEDRMAILSMHIVAPVPRMADRNPAIDVPAPIEELVRKLLEKDAKARPPSARALAEAIEVAAAQSGIDLPHVLSARSFGRESNPDLMRSPAPSAMSSTEVAPQSLRAPESSAGPVDALAATDYGLPASVVNPASGAAHASRPTAGALDGLAERIKAIPRGVLIAVSSIIPICVLALVVTVIVARRSSGVEQELADAAAPFATGAEAPAARPTHAAPERIEAAAAQGPSALEALAKEFPDDTAVQRRLVLAYAEANATREALRAIRALASKDVAAIDEPVLAVVVEAAQRAETADDAFGLLEGGLGERGVDGLIELSSNKKVPAATRTRATKSLSRADTRAKASPAALVFLDLKNAKSCTAKRDLLERVKD